MAVYRDLADRQPDAFLPDLAMYLSNLGATLSELGRSEEALKKVEEAIRILSPFFFQSSPSFTPRMKILAGNYFTLAARAGQPLDLELLLPIVGVLTAAEEAGAS